MLVRSKTNNYIVDLPSNKLTFLDSRFYITSDGDFVPSVTSILECYPKSSHFYEWLKANGKDADTFRDQAGVRGSNVHRLTELYDNGEQVNLFDDEGKIQYQLSEWNMFERYVQYRKACKPHVLFNEITAVSPELRFGGTIDRVIKMKKETILVDLKTSNAIHPHYWLQLAAYKKLIETKMEMFIDGVAILWLNAKTRTENQVGNPQGKGWQMLIERDHQKLEEYWQRFQACQLLWLVENQNSKPSDISYSLSHVLSD